MSSAVAPKRSTSPGARRGRHLNPVADVGASVGYLTIIGIMLFMGTLLATVAVQTLLFQTRISVEDLEAQIAVEQERQGQLQSEVATLESPARILAEAEALLGMSPAPERTYLAPVVPGTIDTPVPPPGEDPFGRDPVSPQP